MKVDTIDNIVRDICAMRGDAQAKNYIPVMRATRRVIEQLSIHVFPDFQNQEYTLPANLLLPLSDTQDIPIMVGCLVKGKELITIPYDPSLYQGTELLTTNIPECSCEKAKVNTSNKGYCLYHGYGDYHYLYGEAYWYQNDIKDRGSWKYDIQKNIIIFNSGHYIQSGTKVVVRFKPIAGREAFQQVPTMYFGAIFQRVNQWMEQGQNVSAANFAKQEFLAEMNMIDDITFRESPEQLADAIRGYNAIKR